MIFAIDCPSHRYFKMDHCPKCESENNPRLQISISKEAYIETTPGLVVRVGSKRSIKELGKVHGIAPIGEIRERAKDGKKNSFKSYSLSENGKRTNGYIQSHGVSERLISSLKVYKNLKRKSINA